MVAYLCSPELGKLKQEDFQQCSKVRVALCFSFTKSVLEMRVLKSKLS